MRFDVFFEPDFAPPLTGSAPFSGVASAESASEAAVFGSTFLRLRLAGAWKSSAVAGRRGSSASPSSACVFAPSAAAGFSAWGASAFGASALGASVLGACALRLARRRGARVVAGLSACSGAGSASVASAAPSEVCSLAAALVPAESLADDDRLRVVAGLEAGAASPSPKAASTSTCCSGSRSGVACVREEKVVWTVISGASPSVDAEGVTTPVVARRLPRRRGVRPAPDSWALLVSCVVFSSAIVAPSDNSPATPTSGACRPVVGSRAPRNRKFSCAPTGAGASWPIIRARTPKRCDADEEPEIPPDLRGGVTRASRSRVSHRHAPRPDSHARASTRQPAARPCTRSRRGPAHPGPRSLLTTRQDSTLAATYDRKRPASAAGVDATGAAWKP